MYNDINTLATPDHEPEDEYWDLEDTLDMSSQGSRWFMDEVINEYEKGFTT